EVDTVEQRAGQPRLIIGAAAVATRAAMAGLARHAASARIHRRDELELCRVADAAIGARDNALAALERLAQRIERLRRKFRQLVEEEDAVMGKRGLAGTYPHAAADKGRHGRGMMRRP